MKKLKKFIDLLNLSKIHLIHKINTLELEKSTLEDVIKNELYKIFMDKLQEPQELNRLKNELKKSREKVKTLKSLLKSDK